MEFENLHALPAKSMHIAADFGLGNERTMTINFVNSISCIRGIWSRLCNLGLPRNSLCLIIGCSHSVLTHVLGSPTIKSGKLSLNDVFNITKIR